MYGCVSAGCDSLNMWAFDCPIRRFSIGLDVGTAASMSF